MSGKQLFPTNSIWFYVTITLSLVLGLFACSDSSNDDDDDTQDDHGIYGTVATGAAISEVSVVLKDAAGNELDAVTTDSSGIYRSALDPAELPSPLQAEVIQGSNTMRSVVYHNASSQVTLHVNPVSEAILSLVENESTAFSLNDLSEDQWNQSASQWVETVLGSTYGVEIFITDPNFIAKSGTGDTASIADHVLEGMGAQAAAESTSVSELLESYFTNQTNLFDQLPFFVEFASEAVTSENSISAGTNTVHQQVLSDLQDLRTEVKAAGHEDAVSVDSILSAYSTLVNQVYLQELSAAGQSLSDSELTTLLANIKTTSQSLFIDQYNSILSASTEAGVESAMVKLGSGLASTMSNYSMTTALDSAGISSLQTAGILIATATVNEKDGTDLTVGRCKNFAGIRCNIQPESESFVLAGSQIKIGGETVSFDENGLAQENPILSTNTPAVEIEFEATGPAVSLTDNVQIMICRVGSSESYSAFEVLLHDVSFQGPAAQVSLLETANMDATIYDVAGANSITANDINNTTPFEIDGSKFVLNTQVFQEVAADNSTAQSMLTDGQVFNNDQYEYVIKMPTSVPLYPCNNYRGTFTIAK